jgi:O-antigen ligase
MSRRESTDATGPWTVIRAVTRAAVLALLACLAAFPLSSLAATDAGLMARLIVLGLIGLAAARPAGALLVCAGLATLGRPVGSALGAPFGLGEPLVLAFMVGWLLHEAVRPRRSGPAAAEVVTPALLFAATVTASLVVPLFHPPSVAGGPLLSLSGVWTFVTREYFADRSRFQTITAGLLLLEGIGLFVAVVTLARRFDSLAERVARMVAACGTGVAALNVVWLLMVSLRGGVPIADLTVGQAPIRISNVFPDVNAAGSYFSMILLLAGGLFLTNRRLRPGWGAALAVIAGALWLTGSRAAFAAASVGVACAVALNRLRARSWQRGAAAGLVVLLLSGAAAAWLIPLGDRHRPVATAWIVRYEMARTALRMFGAHPVFGVGVGRFYPLSAGFSSPEIKQLYPRENAHNNFLQILAELGLVGFAAFAWLLGGVTRGIFRAVNAGGLSPPALGAVGGLTAFLLTCLAGHPLLVGEVAYAFWLVLAVTASLVPAPAPALADGANRRWRNVVIGLLALILAVSLPIRARRLAAESSMGGALVGLSDLQADEHGTSFRWMGVRAQLYVPADARAVMLPLKLDPNAEGGSATIEIRVDGIVVSRVNLTGRNWHDARFLLPAAPRETNFRRIELERVTPDEAEAAGGGRARAPLRVQVGRPRLTGPPN